MLGSGSAFSFSFSFSVSRLRPAAFSLDPSLPTRECARRWTSWTGLLVLAEAKWGRAGAQVGYRCFGHRPADRPAPCALREGIGGIVRTRHSPLTTRGGEVGLAGRSCWLLGLGDSRGGTALSAAVPGCSPRVRALRSPLSASAVVAARGPGQLTRTDQDRTDQEHPGSRSRSRRARA